jgi:endo-1,4-beta-mannosidase
MAGAILLCAGMLLSSAAYAKSRDDAQNIAVEEAYKAKIMENIGHGKKVYFASPMFNHAEKEFNLKIVKVLEEFGYPRDGFQIAQGTPTTARDRYFRFVLSQVNGSTALQGCNFWAWSGRARVCHDWWQPWDDYTGDPAQEEQGLYSVFPSDSTTLDVIREAVNH